MIVEKNGPLRLLRFPTLRRTGIVAAVSTRPLDARLPDHQARLADALDLDAERIATPRQVHKAGIVKAEEGALPPGTEADGVITDVPGQPILMRGADCSLVIVVDPEIRAFGVAHAGWKGAARGVVIQLVRALEMHYGAVASECRAAVGPTIGKERYPVGAEVTAAFLKHRSWAREFIDVANGTLRLDLAGVNARFLVEAGIPAENIETCRLCTSENADLLHSYRRDGTDCGHHALIAAFPE